PQELASTRPGFPGIAVPGPKRRRICSPLLIPLNAVLAATAGGRDEADRPRRRGCDRDADQSEPRTNRASVGARVPPAGPPAAEPRLEPGGAPARCLLPAHSARADRLPARPANARRILPGPPRASVPD